jgi:hypothetical protein
MLARPTFHSSSRTCCAVPTTPWAASSASSAMRAENLGFLIPLPHQGELARYWNDSGRFVAVAASIQAAMEAVLGVQTMRTLPLPARISDRQTDIRNQSSASSVGAAAGGAGRLPLRAMRRIPASVKAARQCVEGWRPIQPSRRCGRDHGAVLAGHRFASASRKASTATG